MKKFSFLMTVFSLIVLFSSCGSDDKKEDPTLSIDYEGFYKGDIVVSLGGSKLDPIPGKIGLIKKSESLAKLELRNFTFGGMNLGDIIVDDVVVTTKANTIYLNGEAKLTLTIEGVLATCNVKVEATVADKKMKAKIDVSVEDPDGGDPLLVNVLFNGDFMDKDESSEAKIISFGLKDIKTTSVIENDTVKLTVEYENREKLANISPEITISEKAKISPAADAEQNFTENVEYIVTAEDGITITKYVVVTTISNTPVLSSEAKIISFGLTDIESTFIIENDTVKLTVDYAHLDKLTSALPNVTISEGASIDPLLDVEQDFNDVLEYTVTAEDGVTETKYTVVTTIINTPVLSSEAKILSFKLKDIESTSVIENDTVKLSVDYKNREKLSNATPYIEISQGAVIKPNTEVTQNFNNVLEYTVTAEDGVTKAKYTVVTTIINTPVLSSEAKILSFKLKDIESTSVIENDTVKLSVDYKNREKLSNATPYIEISQGAVINPSTEVAQNFNNVLEYTVTAEDGVTKAKYTVVTTIINTPVLSSEAKILSFRVKDVEPEPVIDNNIVILSVDNSYREILSKGQPIISISEGATISPAIDMVQNFNEDNVVEYIVTAEDGVTTSKYLVVTTFLNVPQLSKEAKILSFAIAGLNVPVQIESTQISLMVPFADKAKLVNTSPIITISDKATISPAITAPQDFTKPVVYTVTAEDGVTAVSYTVTARIEEEKGNDFSLDMNNVNEAAYTSGNLKGALPNTVEPFKWNSSDGGLKMIIGLKYANTFGISFSQNDTELGGPTFNIQTLNTKGKGFFWGIAPSIPKITSGSLFLGDFDLDTSEPLNSTKFGVLVDKKPLFISGKISYKSGTEYYHCPDPTTYQNHKADLVAGKKDEGLVSIVVYEVSNNDDSLNGTNIYTSDKIIGMAKSTFQDGFKGDFKLNVEYTKEFNPAKKYKLAVILSASKDGDKFSGAGGSLLKLAKLNINLEK